ncbi:MAG: hypothetical protein KKG78_08980, partial [Alphaproteobacteria bacterium]|nr:hypothetical protein [Alphaproteobacteria bacterium]
LCRVSGAAWRTKASNAGTRGPQAVSYGDFDFRLVFGMTQPLSGSTRIDADGPPCLRAARYRRLGGRPDAALLVSMIIMDARGVVAAS